MNKSRKSDYGTVIEKERTNLFIMDKAIWNWAKYRASELGKESVSEYIFELIKLDKQKNLL